MGFAHSPKIATDGLVFYYDTANTVKSYKGEPTVNLAPAGGRTGDAALPRQSYHVEVWTYSIEQNVAGRDSVIRLYINPSGTTSQPYADYGFQVSRPGGSQVGDVYTISMDYYIVKGNNEPGITIAYADGYKTPTSAQAASWGSVEIIDLGEGWYRRIQSATIIEAGNTFWRGGLNSNNIETEAYIDNIQVEFKSHATPFVDGTRSATEGLLDLMKTSTIDLTNVSFDTNAQMTFDGTDDWINLGQVTPLLNSSAVSAEFILDVATALDSNDRKVFHYSKAGTTNGVFQVRKGGNNTQLLYQYNSGGTWYTLTVANAIEAADQYYHFVFTHSGNEVKAYRNGTLLTNGIFAATLDWADADELYIGYRAAAEYWKGNIEIAKFYNKALTAEEVAQNYNAIKGRYGI